MLKSSLASIALILLRVLHLNLPCKNTFPISRTTRTFSFPIVGGIGNLFEVPHSLAETYGDLLALAPLR